MHNTHHMLFNLSKTDEGLNELIMNKDSLMQLRNKIFEFYLALKSDLGIYSFKPPSDITEFVSPRSVKDLTVLTKR